MRAARLIKKSLKTRKGISVDGAQFEVAKNTTNTGEIRMQMDQGNLNPACFVDFLAIAVYFSGQNVAPSSCRSCFSCCCR